MVAQVKRATLAIQKLLFTLAVSVRRGGPMERPIHAPPAVFGSRTVPLVASRLEPEMRGHSSGIDEISRNTRFQGYAGA